MVVAETRFKRSGDLADGRRIQMKKTRWPKLIPMGSAKSRCRASSPQAPVAFSGTTGASGNRRTAIPVFMGRVSPVLDTCTLLMLLEPDEKQETAPGKIHMTGASIFERAGQIRRLEIEVIICGAVSESFYRLLKEAGIDLICGITGDIAEVIDAYRGGFLGAPKFRMPGFE